MIYPDLFAPLVLRAALAPRPIALVVPRLQRVRVHLLGLLTGAWSP